MIAGNPHTGHRRARHRPPALPGRDPGRRSSRRRGSGPGDPRRACPDAGGSVVVGCLQRALATVDVAAFGVVPSKARVIRWAPGRKPGDGLVAPLSAAAEIRDVARRWSRPYARRALRIPGPEDEVPRHRGDARPRTQRQPNMGGGQRPHRARHRSPSAARVVAQVAVRRPVARCRAGFRRQSRHHGRPVAGSGTGSTPADATAVTIAPASSRTWSSHRNPAGRRRRQLARQRSARDARCHASTARSPAPDGRARTSCHPRRR